MTSSILKPSALLSWAATIKPVAIGTAYLTTPHDPSGSIKGYISSDNTILAHIIVTDLLVNDPIISNYDPETVLSVYRQIVQLAPSLSTKQDILRAAMRKILSAGQLEPIDIDFLIKLEKNIGTRGRSLGYYDMARMGGLIS